MVKGRSEDTKLVKNGPYRFIRHPQNLGVLLMVLPFTLYVPFPSLIDPGIRTGDILSWMLMGTLMSISSLVEEKLFIRRIGEEYLNYRGNTGLFLPRLRKKLHKKDFTLWKSVVLRLGIYVVSVGLIYSIQRTLIKLGLVMWTMTF